MDDKILIVDDQEMNREMLKLLLGDEYEYLEADSGRGAVDLIRKYKNEIDAVLLDLMMPDIGGIDVLKAVSKSGLVKKIPFIIVTAEDSIEIQKECFDLGAHDFVGKPYNEKLVNIRVRNAVDIHKYRKTLETKVSKQNELLKRAVSTLQKQTAKLEKANESIIEILGTIVEYRNVESGSHISRVKKYTQILGEKFIEMYPDAGLNEFTLNRIVMASPLHDIGKIAIPDKILLKPGELTDEEFEYMKSHTLRGCEILQSIKNAWDPEYDKICYDICRSHHERYDGGGYPDHLVGDKIPLSAQLVMVADVYDALIHERCYKDAYSKDQAYYMITSGECGVFAPRVMEAFRQVREQMEEVPED